MDLERLHSVIMSSDMHFSDIPTTASAPSVAVPGGAAIWRSSSMPQPIFGGKKKTNGRSDYNESTKKAASSRN